MLGKGGCSYVRYLPCSRRDMRSLSCDANSAKKNEPSRGIISPETLLLLLLLLLPCVCKITGIGVLGHLFLFRGPRCWLGELGTHGGTYYFLFRVAPANTCASCAGGACKAALRGCSGHRGKIRRVWSCFQSCSQKYKIFYRRSNDTSHTVIGKRFYFLEARQFLLSRAPKAYSTATQQAKTFAVFNWSSGRRVTGRRRAGGATLLKCQ